MSRRSEGGGPALLVEVVCSRGCGMIDGWMCLDVLMGWWRSILGLVAECHQRRALLQLKRTNERP